MFTRILVPLDGSQLAELALPYAEELAGAFNSELALVYVCEPVEDEYRHMHQLYIEDMAGTARKRIKGVSSEATVKPGILDGEPAAEIIGYADKNDIRLIVMATHGRSGIMLWAVGSVAHKVLQRISIPMLLIRANVPTPKPGEKGMFSKILVPLDGSSVGEAALPYVEELTKKLESEVILLQVVPHGQWAHTVGGLDYVRFPEHVLESMKTRAGQYLEEVSARLSGTKATLSSEVRLGHAAEEIVNFAKETDTRLVAMSTHGRSGISEWILGSVTQKILHTGSTPLLLVSASGTRGEVERGL